MCAILTVNKNTPATINDVQPFYGELAADGCAIAHNGNLTNANSLRKDLIGQGSILFGNSDSECLIHLIARAPYSDISLCIKDALNRVEGAFAIVAATGNQLFGIRDAMGIRPLVLGKLGNSYVFASETCALDIIGATFMRDVKPGEMVQISKEGEITSSFPFSKEAPRPCVFEKIYFSRPDSISDGVSIYETRERIGEELAREAPVEADLVCPIPDSGTPAAIGFAKASGIPYGLGIVRNQYVGRTFIEPSAQIRNMGVRLKLNVNHALIKDKRVVLVDDSIVRGTTSMKIKDMILAAGAREVHFRIASPPTAWPCFFGVDTPDRNGLLAAQLDEEQMRAHLGVDTLHFISLDGLYRACGYADGRGATSIPRYCDACFSGEYPGNLNIEELDKTTIAAQ